MLLSVLSKLLTYVSTEFVVRYFGEIMQKIIEKDIEKCRQLAQLFPKAAVIHGDGTDQDMLTEEGVQDAYAFVAMLSKLLTYVSTEFVVRYFGEIMQSSPI